VSNWLKRDVLLISLSAFFADAGYQALIAGFPIFLVLDLRAPVYILGIAMALAYGIGSVFAYAGGILSDRYGKKKIAIAGNLLIPILSFTGFSNMYA
jgi:nitrate/nitrite transporter NarK